jgi:hypothetical protein
MYVCVCRIFLDLIHGLNSQALEERDKKMKLFVLKKRAS